jgi:hypothetical protein
MFAAGIDRKVYKIRRRTKEKFLFFREVLHQSV